MSDGSGRRAEYRQFRRLLRNNAYRFLDNDVLPPGSDMTQTLSHVLAILAAFGIALSALLLWKYVLGSGQIARVAFEEVTWPDKQFQIAVAMLVTGFACVATWDGLFPDRRDMMALGALPVRMRTFFAAKALSIAALLIALVFATNAFTFVIFPAFMMKAERGVPGPLIYAAIHAGTIFAAAAFTLLALLAFQGLLIVALRYRTFQRLSSYAQIGALLAILALFLLAPYATPKSLRNADSLALSRWLPPHWFLGLYQDMLGSADAAVRELARIARYALAAAAVLAAVAYSVGYAKIARRALEEPDLAPSTSALWRRASRWFARRLFGNPAQVALFQFIARTLSRNRRSRLLMAGYISIGLGYFLADIAGIIKAGGRQLQSPTPALVGASFVLIFFTLLGMRVLFAMPVELGANWLFRLTEPVTLRDCRTAVRRSMVALGALPLWTLTTPLYASLWGWRPALLHLLAMVLVTLIVAEKLTRNFDKIPFTCTFLPGKANLKLKFGPYVIAFAALTSLLTKVEVMALGNPRPFVILYGIGCVYLASLILRRRRDESGFTVLMFEERPDTVLQLGLSA